MTGAESSDQSLRLGASFPCRAGPQALGHLLLLLSRHVRELDGRAALRIRTGANLECQNHIWWLDQLCRNAGLKNAHFSKMCALA